MTNARLLSPRPVERVWGKILPPEPFAMLGAQVPIGEIWFEDERGTDTELLVKYLFTAERLSIQVHPGDEVARARGHARGKDEAWLVVDAEPGAVIGLGLKRKVSRAELRAAALDGRIEALLDWRPVKAGDFFYSPSGTIHAIGPGLSLIEIQQNLDLTYRLYDYGRPRELHLDKGIAVALPDPWSRPFEPVAYGPGREILAAGGAFVVERWRRDGTAGGDMLLIPLAPGAMLDGAELRNGSVWALDGAATVGGDVDIIATYSGSAVREDAFTAG